MFDLHIVTLSSRLSTIPSIAIVTEYVDHDLLGIQKASQMGYSSWLSFEAIRWITYQLFTVLAYLHSRNIIHRDIKSANLLLSSSGDLKLADFGLSRRISNPLVTEFTNRVITLWYRPPELILGATRYGPEVDIWSAGCIFGELLTGTVLFPNYDECHQLDQIFTYCGYPDDPSLLHAIESNHLSFNKHERQIPAILNSLCQSGKGKDFLPIPPEALDLIDKILQTSPSKRPSAAQVLRHPFFQGMDKVVFFSPCPTGLGFHDLEVRQRIKRNEVGVGQSSQTEYKEVLKNRKDVDNWCAPGEMIDLTLSPIEENASEEKKRQVRRSRRVNRGKRIEKEADEVKQRVVRRRRARRKPTQRKKTAAKKEVITFTPETMPVVTIPRRVTPRYLRDCVFWDKRLEKEEEKAEASRKRRDTRLLEREQRIAQNMLAQQLKLESKKKKNASVQGDAMSVQGNSMSVQGDAMSVQGNATTNVQEESKIAYV